MNRTTKLILATIGLAAAYLAAASPIYHFTAVHLPDAEPFAFAFGSAAWPLLELPIFAAWDSLWQSAAFNSL